MPKTIKGEQSKNRLIKCAAGLFLKNGYNATGINDILKAAELPKGSFYFHFSSKKQLAIEVANYFDKEFCGLILSISEGKTWKEFIRDLIQHFRVEIENDNYYGCPLGVLGIEISFLEPDIAAYYSASMKNILHIFAKVLIFSGIEEKEAAPRASLAGAVYEGYLMYYRISKDINVLNLMERDLIGLCKH